MFVTCSRSMSAALLRMCRNRRCSGVSEVSPSRSATPRMAFIGVRISWLTLAMNSTFERTAFSADCRIACRSRSARLRAACSLSNARLADSSWLRSSVHDSVDFDPGFFTGSMGRSPRGIASFCHCAESCSPHEQQRTCRAEPADRSSRSRLSSRSSTQLSREHAVQI